MNLSVKAVDLILWAFTSPDSGLRIPAAGAGAAAMEVQQWAGAMMHQAAALADAANKAASAPGAPTPAPPTVTRPKRRKG